MTAFSSIASPVHLRRTTVLIVDDSAVVRSELRRQLSAESDVEVIGVAPRLDNLIAQQQADVIVLDSELPMLRAPGQIRSTIEALIPAVIALASPTSAGAATAIEALAAGATDAVAKPGSSSLLDAFGRELIRRINAARSVRPLRIFSGENLLSIGCCTGGVKPLIDRLSELPARATPTLVVHQLPACFTPALVRHLGSRCKIAVREAVDGETLQSDCVLIAPGGRHIVVRHCGSTRRIEIKDGPEVGRERPSFDLLVQSQIALRN
jgi:two-component system chemotaxis response regulator CheB